VGFAGNVLRITSQLPSTKEGSHIGNQLLRSGTAPAANYAEARAAESKRDFLHKMKLCLKELRETLMWLQLVGDLDMCESDVVGPATGECDELVSIFVASVNTVEKKKRRHD
jgi:four helix bundle protein